MKNSCKLILSTIAVLLLIGLLWINIYTLTSPKGDDSRDVEIMKVGWQENRDKIEKIYTHSDYIDQQTQAIDQTIEQFNDTYSEWEDNTSSLSSADATEVVENLLATAPIHWDKNARFTIIEYSELLCWFCQRQSVNGTIQSVIDKFPGEVNSVSRHYIIHWKTALDLAAAIECVAELKSDVYYDVFKKAFEAYPVDMDTLKNIAVELWVDSNNLNTCIEEGRYLQAVEDMMNQWRTVFGITGTPGNVIYDRENGKYQVLPGAYPVENFVSIIESMK